jgi:hypothetical protein
MYQIAPEIWNEIAAAGKVRTPQLRNMMALPAEKMLPALNRQRELLEENGMPPAVAFAYQTMLPLLAEHRAISTFIEETEALTLRSALPEVLTAAEAVEIANLDYPLTSTERDRLLEALLPHQS